MPRHVTFAAAIALLAGLAACDRKVSDTDALDRDLVNGTTTAEVDPALAGALGNQIVFDPTHAKRSASTAQAPAAAVAGPARPSGPGGRACDFPYDLAWARRLPAELPVYPGAKVAEAAGSDVAGCKRRIVSFTAAVPPETLITFYREKLTAAGYSAERLVENGHDVLGGTRGEDAYYISVARNGGGSTVDLIANGG